MRFERQPKRVMYIAEDDVYRATSGAVTSKERKPLAPARILVGVAAAVTFWNDVDRRRHCLGCARTIKDAWLAGDRYMLDTDKARRAAELVADLADTRPDDIDICSALLDLLNAIAEVRLSNTPTGQFDVLQACSDAMKKCFAAPDFRNWSARSRRRRFMYELQNKDRTLVTCTLMGLYFEYGATPLLTSRQRQELLALDRGDGVEGAEAFFEACLRKMTEYCFS